MQRMIVAQENASVIADLLEGDGVTIERHLMATSIVVEPKVIETVACSLTLVSGVAYI